MSTVGVEGLIYSSIQSETNLFFNFWIFTIRKFNSGRQRVNY